MAPTFLRAEFQNCIVHTRYDLVVRTAHGPALSYSPTQKYVCFFIGHVCMEPLTVSFYKAMSLVTVKPDHHALYAWLHNTFTL